MMTRAPALLHSLVLGVALASAPGFAADEPVATNTIDVSMEVASALNSVIALMDAQKLDEAATTMQTLRENLEGRVTDYERFRLLQVSANLHIMRQEFPQAAQDYEAVLALGAAVPAADRQNITGVAAQLYLQMQDWNKALDHLLAVNELLGESDRDTLIRISAVYSQLGQAAAGIPYMEKAVTMAGDTASEDDYNRLAQLYLGAGDNAKAITAYEKLLEIAPDSTRREAVSSNLAALYVQTGSTAKAQTLLRALLREFPASSQAPAWRQALAALGG